MSIFFINLFYIPFLYGDFLEQINKFISKNISFKEIIILYLKHFTFAPIDLEIMFQNSMGYLLLDLFIRNLIKGQIVNYTLAILILLLSILLIIWASKNIKKFYIDKSIEI
ncbi:hypothetical protein UT300007_27510 [Clostridium sp. CTA-7]